MEHITCKHESEIATILSDGKEIRAVAQTHVTFNQFWTVVLLLCGIFGTIMTTNWGKISQLEVKSTAQEVSDAKIVTQLSEIQLDILDIKVSLKEHTVVPKK